MADVTLTVGGYSYTVSCRDGEEDRLRALARMVDQKVEDARQSVGGKLGESRDLLFAALLLADEVDEMASTTDTDESAKRAETLAHRAEALAARLAR